MATGARCSSPCTNCTGSHDARNSLPATLALNSPKYLSALLLETRPSSISLTQPLNGIPSIPGTCRYNHGFVSIYAGSMMDAAFEWSMSTCRQLGKMSACRQLHKMSARRQLRLLTPNSFNTEKKSHSSKKLLFHVKQIAFERRVIRMTWPARTVMVFE